MLKIKTFSVNPFSENCYIVSNEQGDGAIIDCGAYEAEEWAQIKQYLDDEKITLKYSLLTHGHFDHILGLAFPEIEYGLLPYMHEADHEWYDHANEVTISVFGQGLKAPLPQIGKYIHDGEVIKLGNDELKVICTPGHTQGGVCYYAEAQGLLFAGDTLFRTSIGRADLQGGNQAQLIRSITEKLLALPDDVEVFPGHGGPTTIGYERANNYYLM